MSVEIKLHLRMLSDWHIGTGTAAHGHIDRRVQRDADGLPFVPAKTLVGIWRDACEVAANALDSGPTGAWHAWVDHLFGSQPSHAVKEAGQRPDPSTLHPRPAALVLSGPLPPTPPAAGPGRDAPTHRAGRRPPVAPAPPDGATDSGRVGHGQHATMPARHHAGLRERPRERGGASSRARGDVRCSHSSTISRTGSPERVVGGEPVSADRSRVKPASSRSSRLASHSAHNPAPTGARQAVSVCRARHSGQRAAARSAGATRVWNAANAIASSRSARWEDSERRWRADQDSLITFVEAIRTYLGTAD